MENKNIILEVDESTSLMVDKIKSSILSDFIEKISSLRSSLTQLLEYNKGILEDINRNVLVKKDMDRMSDSLGNDIESILDEFADLDEKIQNIAKFPDPRPLVASIEESARKLEIFHENLDRIIMGISESRNQNEDNFANIREVLKAERMQLDSHLENISNRQDTHIKDIKDSFQQQVKIVSDSLVNTDNTINQSYESLRDILKIKAHDLSMTYGERLATLEATLEIRVNDVLENITTNINKIKDRLINVSSTLKNDISEKFLLAQTFQGQLSDKILKDIDHKYNEVSTQLKSACDSINYNYIEINSQIVKLSDQLQQTFEAFNKALDAETQRREEFELGIKNEFDGLNKKIDSLMTKLDNFESKYEENHSSVIERLKQILHTVTPFWKRNKIDG